MVEILLFIFGTKEKNCILNLYNIKNIKFGFVSIN